MSGKRRVAVGKAPAVVLKNLTKVFPAKSKVSDSMDAVVAVRGASLVVQEGESVGLLGQNGSGKSTLLRMLAGVESPTSGSVLVSAKPHLLGVGPALVPQLTGRRNIELGCLAMGMTPAEVRKAQAEIEDFAEIGEAINRPLITYSSGMAARLKFAIGTARPSAILLVDEALSTGDAAFSIKAQDRMQSFLSGSGTLFLVSHAAHEVENNCTRAIWMHQGEIICDGPSDEVCARYKTWATLKARGEAAMAAQVLLETSVTYREPAIIF